MASPPDPEPGADWRTAGSIVPNPEPDQTDEIPVLTAFLRDLVVTTAAVGVWLILENFAYRSGVALLSWLTVPVAAIAASIYIRKIHEWGHFAGARGAGAHAPITRQHGNLVLFQFDMATNTPQQFQAMGIGGQLASLVAVAMLAMVLPQATPGNVAFVATAIAGLFVEFTTDYPPIRRSFAGATNAEAWRPHFEAPRAHRRRAWQAGLASAGIWILVVLFS